MSNVHEQLLQCLRSKADLRSIHDVFNLEGSLKDARAWVVANAASDEFGRTMLAGIPETIRPVLHHLWEMWRRRDWQSNRRAIKHLRHVVWAMAQMEKAFRQCAEAMNCA